MIIRNEKKALENRQDHHLLLGHQKPKRLKYVDRNMILLCLPLISDTPTVPTHSIALQSKVKLLFWGGNRVDYCGQPGYHLDCQNGITEIEIMSLKYQVLDISCEKQFVDDPCPSNYTSSTLDLNLFDYTPDSISLTLFYVCPVYSPQVDLSHKSTCGSRNESNAYFYANSSGGRTDCEWKISVPILQIAGVRLESDVLRNEFEMRIVGNNFQCDECSKSGGECGHDLDSDQFICFCNDISHRQQCSTLASSFPSPHGPNPSASPASGGVSGAVAIFAILCIWKRKFFSRKFMVLLKKKSESAENVEAFLVNYGSLSSRRYKHSEIEKMTNSFQYKLGQGGYGSVFKGALLDGRSVAVKLLSESKDNGEEFINEVASISKTSHVNIVTLLVFYVKGNKRALIYEFMLNGSLEKFIYDKACRQLGWNTLYNIALGIARGLEYLHRGCNTKILHFDIKPHNILLDLYFCPKIADFGLSKLCLEQGSVISCRGTRGTPGFIAPGNGI